MEQHSTSALFYDIWGGRFKGALTYVLTDRVPNLDIYCFTEVTDTENESVGYIHTSDREREPPMSTDSLTQLRQALPGYRVYFGARGKETMTCLKTRRVVPGVRFGSALFLKPSLKVIDIGEALICADQPGRHPRILQWVVYRTDDDTRYLIAHLHGVWIKENTKGDHPIRFQQSREVRTCLARVARTYIVDKIVFGGDLNLALDTQALAQLLCDRESDLVLRNLITEHQVECTRTELYRKYYTPEESHHADYVLVSPSIAVHHFAAMINVRISDHAPLLVRFS